MIVVNFLLLATLTVSASIVALFDGCSKPVKNTFLVCLVVSALAASWTTFVFTRYANENALVHGWPVPLFIAYRPNSNSSWELAGSTTILAFPMNLFLFSLLPSLGVIVSACVSRFRAR